MSTILQCKNLSKDFAGHPALEGITLEVGAGKVIGLLGPNGSGKTTLIKLINGLLQPSNGEVLVDGMKPGPETKALVSYLPDKLYFADWMTVNDAVSMFDDFYADFERARAEEMAANLALDLNAKIKSLSKGTKEKVQLILVMSRRAKLYLLDEPIGGVDPAARDYILDTILNNYSEDSTIIISTHLIADVERIFDDAIFLQRGKVVISGSVDAIRQEHGQSLDGIFREVFKC